MNDAKGRSPENAIWLASLPQQAKLLFCYLLSIKAKTPGAVQPSYNQIIRHTGLSRSSVAKYMSTLEREGWLIRTRGERGTITTYQPQLPNEETNHATS